MTNKHVVADGTQTISVITADGTQYKNVKLVGRDPLNDLAFLKVQGAKNLTPARLADSNQVNIGQKVIAIGNALGQYQNSVTAGIISAIGRPVVAQEGSTSEQLEGLFQTDAAINPGNSGGPLVNLEGQVIGINTAIAPDAQGIGFSIPVNSAKGDIKSVISSGQLKRSYLGVHYISITPEIASTLNLDVKQGAYIYDNSGNSPIVSDSPAAKAGLHSKDIVTKVNNETVDARHGLAGLLAQYAPGTKVTLTIIRDGQNRQVDVTLGQYNGNTNG